ncbi:MAG: hypothetical protein ABJO02_16435 [Reichenbachiella sp.]|uniref:hypothetical protein n=1 Tax=Reichenbachiella sp. TaxID=2184521 RepID=UPI003296D22D
MDPIAIGSLLVNIGRFFNDLRKEKSPEKKVIHLTGIFKTQKDFFILLSQAKGVHDSLQKIWSTQRPDFISLYQDFDSLTGKEIRDNLDNVINLIQRITSGVDLVVAEVDFSYMAADLKEFPPEFILGISECAQLYPLYANGVKNFNKNFRSLENSRLTDARLDLSKDFRTLGYCIKDTLQYADDLIIKLIPIVSYLNFEITRMISHE